MSFVGDSATANSTWGRADYFMEWGNLRNWDFEVQVRDEGAVGEKTDSETAVGFRRVEIATEHREASLCPLNLIGKPLAGGFEAPGKQEEAENEGDGCECYGDSDGMEVG